MDKRAIYDGLADLQQQLQRDLKEVTILKEAVSKLVAENATLEMENQHLRSHLLEVQKGLESGTSKQELSKARMNLEKLYEEGFHVCNVLYGTRRENEEECAFCLEVIYGDRNK